VLVVEVEQETTLVELVAPEAVVMAQPIQDREQQELTTLAAAAVEVLSIQQDVLAVLVSSSLLIPQHK